MGNCAGSWLAVFAAAGRNADLRVVASDMEVWAYALRELALVTSPEAVPAGICDRARTFLEGMAAAAGVAYQPLVGHAD